MKQNSFKDQVAVVTGAGEGIGFEIARQLAGQGAAVLLNDMNGDLAVKAAQEIGAEGGTCLGVGGDVAEVQVVRDLVDRAVAEFGRLTIAVANAGLSLWDDFFDFKPEDFQRVLAVNLGGSFFLAQAAARQMRQQETAGRILFLSSVAGNQAIATSSVYAMTKKGLEMLARSLVSEVSSHDITVNAIAPGATITPPARWPPCLITKRSGRPSYPPAGRAIRVTWPRPPFFSYLRMPTRLPVKPSSLTEDGRPRVPNPNRSLSIKLSRANIRVCSKHRSSS